jgi:DNA-binding NarL/FixJ family response regulator
MGEGLTREFLAERDVRIFGMRKAGVSTAEIAKRFGISSSAVNAAVNRQLSRLNREALMAYPEVLRLELERLDALQQAIWPLTQHRKITAPDGTEMVVEPDLKAIQQVLAIMDRRSRLLGMETAQVSITVDSTEQAPQRAVLAGADQAAAADAFDPETEARQLLELMGQSGVLPREQVETMLGQRIEQPALSNQERDVPEIEVVTDVEVIE